MVERSSLLWFAILACLPFGSADNVFGTGNVVTALAHSGGALGAVLTGSGLFGAGLSAAAAIAALLAVAFAVRLAIRPQPLRGNVFSRITALRARSWRRRPPRQCDPDAAGHARPRAPGQPA